MLIGGENVGNPGVWHTQACLTNTHTSPRVAQITRPSLPSLSSSSSHPLSLFSPRFSISLSPSLPLSPCSLPGSSLQGEGERGEEKGENCSALLVAKIAGSNCYPPLTPRRTHHQLLALPDGFSSLFSLHLRGVLLAPSVTLRDGPADGVLQGVPVIPTRRDCCRLVDSGRVIQLGRVNSFGPRDSIIRYNPVIICVCTEHWRERERVGGESWIEDHKLGIKLLNTMQSVNDLKYHPP